MTTPFQLQHCPISLHLPPSHGRTPSVLPAGDLFQTPVSDKQKKRRRKKQTSKQTAKERNRQNNKQANKQRTDNEQKSKQIPYVRTHFFPTCRWPISLPSMLNRIIVLFLSCTFSTSDIIFIWIWRQTSKIIRWQCWWSQNFQMGIHLWKGDREALGESQ